MAEKLENSSQEKNCEKVVDQDNSNQGFVHINKVHVLTADYEHEKWSFHHLDLSAMHFFILKIENCSDISSACGRLKYSRNARFVFVLVLEFPEKIEPPTDSELKEISDIFFDHRPAILQFKTSLGSQIFVKNYFESKFIDLRATNGCLAEILNFHCKFDGDILTSKLSAIPESFSLSEHIPKCLLCIRFLSLYENGWKSVPWLTEERLLECDDLQFYLAYMKYPFDLDTAMRVSLKTCKPQSLEVLVARDCRFPKDFNMDRVEEVASEEFKNLINQREELHQNIKDGNLEEINRILSSTRNGGRFQYLFNQSNDCAMATAIRHYNSRVYEALMHKRLQLSDRCKKYLEDLPKEMKDQIREINQKFFTSVKKTAGMHELVSKCFFATETSNSDFHAKKIDQFLDELEKCPETSLLLRLIENYSDVKIVFDFDHQYVTFIDPNEKGFGICYCDGTILIAENRIETSMAATLAHELTHLAMLRIYNNEFKPFSSSDVNREEEFNEIIKEFKNMIISKRYVKTCTIKNVWRNYRKKYFYDEIIARASEILVRDPKSVIDDAMEKYPKLFAYYSKYIPTDIETELTKIFTES